MKYELLPCPFCGGKPDVIIKGNNLTAKRSVIVKCTSCRVQRTNAGFITPIATLVKISTEQWNMRNPESKANCEN